MPGPVLRPLREGREFTPPPEIQLLEVETEAGFANSLSIESPDDEGLPQIKDLDGWNEWID